MTFIQKKMAGAGLLGGVVLVLTPQWSLAAKSVTLTVSPTSVVVGSTVKLSAVVANPPLTGFSGKVHFQQDGVAIAGSPVSAVKGAASLTTPAQTVVGNRTFRAAYYFSDAPNTPVYSANVVVPVTKKASSMTWGTLPAAVAGGSATLSVTVAGYLPTGNVTLTNTTDGTSCTGAVNTTTRVASCAVNVLGAGNKQLSASYAGDANNNTSTAGTVLTAAKATANVTWGTLPSVAAGVAADLSVTVTGYKPTGNVTISNTTDSRSCTAAVNASGVATCQLTFPSTGTKTLSASYAGDASNTAKTATASVVAKAATAIGLTSPVVVRWAGSNTVDLNASLTTGAASTGSVRFESSLNGGNTYSPLMTASLNGSRQLSARVALPGVGKHLVRAVFLGDANQAASESIPVVIEATTPLTAEPVNGTYARQVYVDIAAPACSDTCGSAAAPFQNLKAAFAVLTPGTEMIVAGRAGFAYYVEDHGKLPASNVVAQHFLTLPSYPKPRTIPQSDPNDDPPIDIANPTADPAMSPSLVRAWQGVGGSRPVVRGSAKVGGWQTVSESDHLYSRVWDVKAQGLANVKKDANGVELKDANGNPVYEFTTVMRPQQIFRDTATGPVKLVQVGGVLYNQSRYDSQEGVLDYRMSFQWPMRGGDAERPIGRIAPAGGDPWLSLANNQFYVHAPLQADGVSIDNKQPLTVYVKLDSTLPPGEALEVGVQQFLLDTCVKRVGCAANLTLRDIVFERGNGSAFSPQNSAVLLAGENVVADNVVLQDADAICTGLWGKRVSLLNSTIERCGQLGIAASGSGHLIKRNKVRYNNDKGFNENWAAGGMKFISDDTPLLTTVQDNDISFNDGTGIWLDTNPTQFTIEGNYIGMNGRVGSGQLRVINGAWVNPGSVSAFGVHLEIVQSNTVRRNTIVGNAGPGIHLIGNNTGISDNFISANMGPAVSRPSDARLAQTGLCAVTNSGNDVNHNLMAWNDEMLKNPDGGINFITLMRTVADVSNHNAYCASGVSLGSAAVQTDGSTYCNHAAAYYYDLPQWQSVTGQDAQSTRVIRSFSTTIGSARIEQIKQRSPQFWDTVLNNTFQNDAVSVCGAPAGWSAPTAWNQ